MTAHAPHFPTGRSSTNPFYWVCDAVFHSSMDEMQNVYPPATAAPHIPLSPSSIKRISSSGPVSPLSASSLFGELFMINYFFTLVTPTNDIYKGYSAPELNNDQSTSKPSYPLDLSPHPTVTTPKLNSPGLASMSGPDLDKDYDI